MTSASGNQLEIEVMNYFKSNHISVRSEWVQACIEWIEENHIAAGRRYDSGEVPRLAYGQWLLANLRELQTCCLPQDLQNQKRIIIEGHFPLQLESIREIGQPAYQQYLKVAKVDYSNAQVTAEPSQHSQLQKHQNSSRLLKMEMTDGTQDISGMEYEPIPSLNVNMPPGLKVLIFGKIECRRGILLLTNANVKILGGDVFDLQETNAQICVLKRVLDRSYATNSSDRGTETSINPIQPQNVNLPRQQWTATADIAEVEWTPTRGAAEAVRSCTNVSTTCKQPHPLDDVWDDIDFVFDDSSFLESLPSIGKKSPQRKSVSQSSVVSHSDDVPSNLSGSRENSKLIKGRNCSSKLSLASKTLTSGSSNNIPVTGQPRSSSATFPSPDNEQLSEKNDLNTNTTPSLTANVSSLMSRLTSQDTKKHLLAIELDDSDESNNFQNQPGNTTCEPVCSSSYFRLPFQYLCHLPSLPVLMKLSYRVKAFVMTLATNLESNSGQRWHLKALINDGTASLMVEFSDNVLKKIVGLSAQEYHQLKQAAKNSAEARQQKATVLKQCSQHLINLCCIMDLECYPGIPTPCILNLEEPTKDTVVALRARQVKFEIF